MYHIVICDDEPIFLTQISEMIIDILASMGESCEIRKYTSISELKNTLQNTPKSCDILILDIMLGENNGISFAECLRDTENQIPGAEQILQTAGRSERHCSGFRQDQRRDIPMSSGFYPGSRSCADSLREPL